ncbi:MAG: hypothetical protein F8N39_14705 [Clostridiaceae bacterium]|nr:hypothetical protein [Clostridiaceae bacterium]
MAKIIFLIWFILFSMISIYMCLSVALVNKSVVIGFGIIAMFLSLIYVNYVCVILNMYHPNYFPTYMLLNFDNLSSETSYNIIVNCIILIVSTTVLGGFIFERQDIK